MFEKEKLIAAVATVIAFAVSTSQNEVDDTIVEDMKTALDGIDLENPPSQSDAETAVFDVLEELADLTESDIDDKVVQIAETVFNISGGGGFISRLIARLAERRRKKLGL